MRQFSEAGYDRALTVFSPDGRLFQIEYAREAVKRGTTSVGIISKEGVVFAVDKKIKSKLIVPSSIEKIFKIDDHIATASSGKHTPAEDATAAGYTVKIIAKQGFTAGMSADKNIYLCEVIKLA